MYSICVFCASSDGSDSIYKKHAIQLGKLFAKNKIRLVYGGGGFGLMGAIANSVMDNGGEVVGVIPDRLVQRERAHKSITELIIVNTMNDRKEKMAELSDAFVTMPGGYGTLDELFEMLTWNQLGIHNKPCVIYNVNGFYDALLNQLKQSVNNGFLRKEVLDQLTIYNNDENMIASMLK